MKKLWSEEGQGLLEYAFLIILVAILVMVIVIILGEGIGNIYDNIISNF